MLTVVAMGMKRDDLTIAGLDALKKADHIVIKSQRTHMAEALKKQGLSFVSCDDLYDVAEDFTQLDTLIAQRLSELDGNVVFCVVGEGSDDSTVQYLAAQKTPFSVVHGVSALQYVVPLCGTDGVRTFTAQQFVDCNDVNAIPTVIKYVDDKYIAADIKLKLLECFDFDTQVVLYDGKLHTCTVEELDRQHYNHLTTLFVCPGEIGKKKVFDYKDVVRVMQILRAPDGCPWDREQTHMSIKKNVIEEAYELAHAIDTNDTDNIVEELGDLLMQVVFHLEIARDEGEFTAQDVYTALCRKLIDRHPHVFGDVKAVDGQQALESWEKVKRKQHKIKSLTQNLTDVPYGMSALMRCSKVQYRAGKEGYDFKNVEDATKAMLSELDELKNADDGHREEEGGDLLFAAVNVLRLYGVDAETALISATEKFIGRVAGVEKKLGEKGKTLKQLTDAQFDELWQQVKKEQNR